MLHRGSLDAEAASLLDAAQRDESCPRCGAPDVWDGDTEASRVCGSCRAEEADYYRAIMEDEDV